MTNWFARLYDPASQGLASGLFIACAVDAWHAGMSGPAVLLGISGVMNYAMALARLR